MSPFLDEASILRVKDYLVEATSLVMQLPL